MSEEVGFITETDGPYKWALLDYGGTAHWWVGSSGTACGRDFRVDLRMADVDDPRCQHCKNALSASLAEGARYV